MTVKELIKELQKWDPNMEIRIEDSQWAQPIKAVIRDLYYTDSDGKWCCVDKDVGEGLTSPKILLILKHQ